MRIILVLITLTISTSILSKTVNVVEIANFYCQECYQANRISQKIEHTVRDTGGIYDFVPIFLDYAHVWPSKVFLSMKQDAEFQRRAKDALFTAANISGVSMKTAESACIIVREALSRYPFNECVKHAKSEVPNIRISRAITLLHHIYTDPNDKLLFPIYVVEQNNEIKAVFTRHIFPDVIALVNEVDRYVKSIH